MSLLLADGNGETVRRVHNGLLAGAFWLDEQTYAYLRRPAEGVEGPAMTELVAGTVLPGKEEVLLTIEDLSQFLPLEPEVYNLTAVVPNPANRNKILLQVVDYTSSSASAALFQLERSTGAVTYLADIASWRAPVIAPDGNWLALYSFDRASGQNSVTLYEPESGREMHLLHPGIGAFAWSPDGRWLLHAGSALLHLAAPDDNYRQVLAFSGPSCSQVAWVK